MAEDINNTIRFLLQGWHMPFQGYVNKCDVTDTLLLHSATEVSFQSVQQTR